MRLFKCYMCGAIFNQFRYKYDSSPRGDDEAVCPKCGCDDGFEEVTMTEYYQKVLDLFKQYELDKKYYDEDEHEGIEEYIGVYEENGDITLQILYDNYESIEFNICIEHFNGDMDFTFKSSCHVGYEIYSDKCSNYNEHELYEYNFSKFISSEEEFKTCFKEIQGTETFYQLQENEKFVGCELIEKIISLAKE